METLAGPEAHLPREQEYKLVPTSATAYEYLSHYREMARPLEQMYLSHPSEPYSLRLRQSGDHYSATLKGRDQNYGGPLRRIEIEATISDKTYEYFKRQGRYPIITKARAQNGNETCDWYPHLPPLVEVEADNSDTELHVLRLLSLGFKDVSHVQTFQNEHMAYQLHPEKSNRLHVAAESSPKASEIADKALDHVRHHRTPYVVGIRGRSGSGKTTLATEISNQLEAHVGPVMRLSTDDYHRGKSWLLDQHDVDTWNNWDDPVVYDTELLAQELRQYLAGGTPIARRKFNFTTEETEVLTDTHEPSMVVVVEGLFPHAPQLKEHLHQLVEIPTPLATCIGRRIMRDINSRLNNSLGSATDILRYQLETAEPTYQTYS